MNDDLCAFLDVYLHENGLSKNGDKVKFVHFSNNEEDSTEDLTNLLAGRKHAAFKIKDWFDKQELKHADVGTVLVFADYYGVAMAIVKVREREFVTYGNITERITKAIAIGDGSIDTWKAKRERYIRSNCEVLNTDFNNDLEMIIFWFDIIYLKKINIIHS